MPSCGACRYCATGRSSLCDRGARSVEFKRDTALEFGATHAFADPQEAAEKVHEITWGQGADQALVTVGVVKEKVSQDAFDIVGKGGIVVVTGLGKPEELTIHVSGAVLTKFEKTIKGSIFGTLNPQYDIVKLLRLDNTGELKLDELATRHYKSEEINQDTPTCGRGRSSGVSSCTTSDGASGWPGVEPVHPEPGQG